MSISAQVLPWLIFERFLISVRSYIFEIRSWFKGADTTAVLLFLQDFLEHIATLEEPDPFLDSLLEATISANTFLSTLYKAGLFLEPEVARLAAQSGLNFLRSYAEAAQLCFDRGVTRCKLNPKYHAFIHMVDRLCEAVDKQQRFAFNPLSESTQMSEDFVGKIALLSCAVSTRTVHLQAVSRYLTEVWRHLEA